ncbi:MAG: hypothetical protein MJ108_08730 [Saccharofermentans sp.]|nr:hypothetical protein [Saccharofermentans sp.]
MKTKKILATTMAVGMTLSMTLGMTGCAAISNPLKKYTNVLDDMDFEKVDAQDYRKMDEEDGDFEDGAYALSNNARYFKGLVGDFTYADITGSELASVLAARKWVEDEDHSSNFSVYILQYKNEDDAEDFFDDLDELLGEDTEYFDFWRDYGDFEAESDDDYYLLAGYVETDKVERYLRVVAYRDGKTVVVARAVSQGDDAEDFVDLMDDFCDGADLENPSDLL